MSEDEFAIILEAVIERTRHEPYRDLCSPDHPNYIAFRNSVVMIYRNERMNYPPVAEQASSATKAAVEFAASGFEVVSKEVAQARLAICEKCEWFEPQQARCYQCGCWLRIKTFAKAMKCPIGKW